VEISGRLSNSVYLNTKAVRVRVSTGTVTTGSTLVLFAQMGAQPGVWDSTWRALWTPASTSSWNLAVTVQAVGNAASFGPPSVNPVISVTAV